MWLTGLYPLVWDWDYLKSWVFRGNFPLPGVQATIAGRLGPCVRVALPRNKQAYHYLLKQGQTGLSVAFDLPTPNRL